VLDPAEARALLDSIDTANVAGLRDRALTRDASCHAEAAGRDLYLHGTTAA
jgi:hypothetical protein